MNLEGATDSVRGPSGWFRSIVSLPPHLEDSFMHSIARLSRCFAIVVIAAVVSSPNAQAEITISIDQQGDDVVASYSGSWDSWRKTGDALSSSKYIAAPAVLHDLQGYRRRVAGSSRQRFSTRTPSPRWCLRKRDLAVDVDLASVSEREAQAIGRRDITGAIEEGALVAELQPLDCLRDRID